MKPVSAEKKNPATLNISPGIDIHRLSVGTLLSQLDANGAEDFKIDPGHYSTAWQTLIQARKEFTEKSSEVLLKDL